MSNSSRPIPVPSAVISVPISWPEHPVEARALDVQDLAAQGQHGLVVARTALLGGATGAVTLHQEQLGLGRVLFLAIGELAGQEATSIAVLRRVSSRALRAASRAARPR
jgi:hypothetical protein